MSQPRSSGANEPPASATTRGWVEAHQHAERREAGLLRRAPDDRRDRQLDGERLGGRELAVVVDAQQRRPRVRLLEPELHNCPTSHLARASHVVRRHRPPQGPESDTVATMRLAEPARALLPATALALLVGCTPTPSLPLAYEPASLRFDGERALDRLRRFVTDFPRRHSGTDNNRRAAASLESSMRELGLRCERDAWRVINFSRELPLGNVVCRLPGADEARELVLVAHHDQSPQTIEGADNDGSGLAILVGLAEVFAEDARLRDAPLPYTMVFLASDGEEWGMLGARRYVARHPDPSTIVAAISLDNLGKRFYDGLILEPTGQFRGYGPLWLSVAARLAARAAVDADPEARVWIPDARAPAQQLLDQAVPISFMDQGPFVAAGVPALGFAGRVPPEHAEEHWRTYHAPGDTQALQSAESLARAGRAVEALARQLQGMDEVPRESGPYLHDADARAVLRGPGLWAIFIGLVALLWLGALAAGGWRARRVAAAWRRALPHALSLWLPLVGSALVLRGLVGAGLMLDFHLYPATAKHPEIYSPRWPAVAVYLVSLIGMLWCARRLARRQPGDAGPTARDRKSVGLALVGAAALYILVINPCSLLFLAPALAWLAYGGRRGVGRALDVVALLLGGGVVYLLLYFFGFVILRSGLGVLWYLMMMFAIGMIRLPTAVAIAAAIAGGLCMAVGPPRR
ncbi:MAG: M28 family peptidase [Myxococcales bacterium]|nr:M28 family peptidase [Myxococcales bacterium]